MPDTLTYERDGPVARITLDRPERGNGITLQMPAELRAAVEEADLDPEARVILLSGNGRGFCGGYDLMASAEGMAGGDFATGAAPPGSPLDPLVQARNHDPSHPWDPLTDFQMMRRNVRGFMSLLEADLPVVCRVHGFCIAGGTDMALCSDLLVIADDATIGYPPARVWGAPTTTVWAYRVGAQRAARMLLTGDRIDGRTAAEWGLAAEAHPPEELVERTEELVGRMAQLPRNQLIMQKLWLRQALLGTPLHATQTIGTLLDGAARHTPEGYAFQQRAAEAGWRTAVRERDDPFGDTGRLGG